MKREILRAKLHKLTVTEANVNYEGSITIDKKLLKAADIAVGEKVQIINLNNAKRFETYVIEGKAGEICLNGGAALLVSVGDRILVIAYGIVDENELKSYKPKVVLVDEKNNIKGR